MTRSWDSAEVEQLLEHREALRRIVVRLIGPADAEDVVQETYARALAAPPAQGEPARWLARIARNVASTWRRDQRRRARRELRAARSGAQEGRPTDELLAELEALERVSRALRELPEPYRGTLVLRFVQGASTERIAAAQGVGPDAVRQRLKRGLDLLRDRVAPHDADRRGLALAMGMAWRATCGTASAPVAGGSVVGAVSRSMLLIWGVLVVTLQKLTGALVVVVVLGGLVGTLVLGGGGAPTDPADGSAASQGGSVRQATGSTAAEELDAPDEARLPVDLADGASPASAAFEAPGSLEVRVRWQDDGEPAVGLDLSLRDPYSLDRGPIARSDAEGVVVFADLAPGRHEVGWWIWESTGSPEIEIVPGERKVLEVTIERGVTVVGRVVDDLGRAIPGARVLGTCWAGGWAYPMATTDDDGYFRIERAPHHGSVGASAPGYAPSPLRQLIAEEGALVETEIALSRDGARLLVRVADGGGEPIAGALAAAGPFGQQNSPRRDAHGVLNTRVPWPCRTDSAGRCELAVAAGRVEVQVRADGLGPWSGFVDAPVGGALEVPIRLTPGVTLEGVARDSSGRPLAEVSIRSGMRATLVTRAVATDDAGRYVLTDLPSGALELRAQRMSAVEKATLQGVPGQTLRWDPVFDAGRKIVGRVVDPKGAPVEELMLEFRVAGRPDWHDLSVSRSAGHFEVEAAPDEGTLQVFGRRRLFEVLLHEGPLPEAPLELLWDENRHGDSARLEGRLVDPEGRPVADSHMSLVREDMVGGTPIVMPETDGRFAFEVPPGRYRFLIEADGFACERTGFVTAEPDGVADFGTIALEIPAAFRIRFHARRPLPEDLVLSYSRQDDERWYAAKIAGGEGGAGALKPGDYRMRLGGDGFACEVFEIHLPAGRNTEIVRELRNGSPVRFMVDVALGAERPDDARLEVLGEEDRLLVDRRVRIGSDGIVQGDWRLDPGRYRARLTEQGLRAERSFEMHVDGAVDVELTLR